MNFIVILTDVLTAIQQTFYATIEVVLKKDPKQFSLEATSIQKIFYQAKKRWYLLVVFTIAALLGAILTLRILAAPVTLSLEAEQGTRAGNTQEVTMAGASGGKAVEFKAGSSDDPGGSPGGGNLPAPTWSDEFTSNTLSYATDNGGGTWRTKGYESGSVNSGYNDYVGSTTWNAPKSVIEQYNLINVEGGILKMRTMRNPGIPGVDRDWIGTYLVTNHLKNLTWRYGYFEWRMSLPNPSLGMFPALWLFNNVPDRNTGTESAEIDVLEVFGYKTGSPWDITLHMKPVGEGQVNFPRFFDDTTDWHRYALNWTADALTFYKDGEEILEVTGPRAAWYRNTNLGIRMDYVMDPGFGNFPKSTPTDPAPGVQPRMEIDYVRYYAQMPANMRKGAADPSK